MASADIGGFAVGIGSESLADEIDKGTSALDDLGFDGGCISFAAVEVESLESKVRNWMLRVGCQHTPLV